MLGSNNVQMGFHLQHDNTNATTLLDINLVLCIDTRRQICGAVVEQVVVQLAIASTELLVCQEERIVEEGKSVEDVEPGLNSCVSVLSPEVI